VIGKESAILKWQLRQQFPFVGNSMTALIKVVIPIPINWYLKHKSHHKLS